MSEQYLSAPTTVNSAPVQADPTASDLIKRSNGSYYVTKADLLKGFFDPDGDQLDISWVSATNASVSDLGDGRFRISPNEENLFTSYQDAGVLTYSVTDGTNQTGAEFNYRFRDINHAPVLSGPAAEIAGVREDTSFTVTKNDLLKGFTDPDGDTVRIYYANYLGRPEYTPLRVNNAQVSDNRNGTYTIRPNQDYNGPLTIYYAVADQSVGYEDAQNDLQTIGAQLTININPVNDPPHLVKETLAAVSEDSGSIYIDASTLLANDYSAQNDEKGETFKITNVYGAGGGTATLTASGDVIFVPAKNFNGAAYFYYTVTDNGTTDGKPDPQSASKYVYIPITAINDAPTITTSALATMTEDVTAAIRGITFADVDAGSSIVRVTLKVGAGSVAASSGAGVTVSGDGTGLTFLGTVDAINSFIAAGSVKYTPTKDANGPVALDLSITDNGAEGDGGSLSVTSAASLAVNAVNDAPTLSGSQAVLRDGVEDVLYIVSSNDLLKGFTDVDDGPLTIVNAHSDRGKITINSDGTLSIRFDKDYNGPITLNYGVSDGKATTLASRSFAVAPVADAPVATNDAASVLQRQSVAGNVLSGSALDYDPDGEAIAVSRVDFGMASQAVASGYASLAGAHGTLSIKGDGSYTYVANAEGGVAVGDTVTDSFSYAVSDGRNIGNATLDVSIAGSAAGDSGANQFWLLGAGTTATGFAGNDTYIIDGANDKIIESAGVANGFDTIFSSVKVTRLTDNIEKLVLTGSFNLVGTGNDLGNIIVGNRGGNTLDGGLGKDVLTGGAGRDTFFFSTKPDKSNLDHIKDFRPVDDTIKLENSGSGLFTKLSKGALDSDALAFVTSGKAVVDDDVRILYDKGHGVLYYDPNGGSASGRVEFAVLDNHAALTYKDFLIV